MSCHGLACVQDAGFVLETVHLYVILNEGCIVNWHCKF